MLNWLIKAGGKPLINTIHKIGQQIWRDTAIPKEWTKSILILIPKRGDLKKCENYRTISLIKHSDKILLSVLLQRLRSKIELHLSEEQAGFRKDCNTIQQILCLRLIAEKHCEVNREVFNCFVDFRKASDLAWNKGLWTVLKSYGSSHKLIKSLQNIYKDATAAVMVNGS